MERFPFKFARIFFIMLAAFFLFGSTAAYAEASDGDSAGEAVTLNPSGYRNVDGANGFDVTLSYSEPISCNTPVTFTVNATGHSGQLEYKIYSMDEAGTRNEIQSFNMMPFQDSNEFKITFDYSCGVDLTIQVSDKTSRGTYTRPYFSFTVNDPDSVNKNDIPKLAEEKAKQAYDECMSKGFTNQYDKALWLHNWVIDNCVYDRTYRHTSASDVFVLGTGTCEAYHAAYMDLLRRVGIECGRVSDDGHVWTLVKLDGEWCHVDTTGDDTDGDKDDWFLGKAGRSRLFGLNDDIITAYIKTQNPDKEIKVKNPTVAAKSLKNNYLIRSGEIRKYSDTYRSSIQAAIDRGESSFALPIDNTKWPPSYKTLVYSLAAYQLSSEAWYQQGKAVPLQVSYADDTLIFTTIGQMQPAPVETQPMYRLYNRLTGEHFYTASAYERDVLKAGDWNYEGIGWYAPTSGTPVYRLWNGYVGEHHYTTSAYERDYIVKYQGWTYEGIGWYSGGSTPLYRLYNPDWNMHHYTTSTYERDIISRYQGWNQEGIGWYGL